MVLHGSSPSCRSLLCSDTPCFSLKSREDQGTASLCILIAYSEKRETESIRQSAARIRICFRIASEGRILCCRPVLKESRVEIRRKTEAFPGRSITLSIMEEAASVCSRNRRCEHREVISQGRERLLFFHSVLNDGQDTFRTDQSLHLLYRSYGDRRQAA